MRVKYNTYVSTKVRRQERRVGKTELLLKFLEKKKGVYLIASTKGDRQNIKDFSKVVGRFISDENLGALEFDSWQSFFEAHFKHKAFDAMLKKEKIILIINEFPFLIQSNKDIPSIFHKIWELIMKREPILTQKPNYCLMTNSGSQKITS